MTIEAVLARLEGVRRSGSSWEAKCPAHEDGKPSLSVSEGDKGVVLHCHAGCTQEAVVGALGLDWSDLFTEERGPGARPEIVDTYDYTDEDGRLLSQAVRFFPKDFRQRTPDGRGGWSWKLNGVRRVLYRLPQVLEAVSMDKLIHLCEGEKDVHALESIGAVATTNPMGAGKWRAEYSESLRGARVRIIADRDEAGLEHAQTVARALEGIAETVEIL
ncbi:MAG: hypothetical protein ACF8Q5_01235, partial [Phycisphaerales bacterium JB040]